jgi:cysteine-rich repeat protein
MFFPFGTALRIFGALVILPTLVALGCAKAAGSGDDGVAQGQAVNGAPITISLTTPPALAPTAALLNATGSVTVGSMASASGVIVQTSSTGDVNVSPEATLGGDVWAAGAAIVGPLAQIEGTLHAATTVLDPSAVIGSVDNHPVFSPPNALSWQISIPSGPAPDVHATTGQTSSIAAGPYGTVTVDTGGTLKLHAGNYYATTFALSQGSTLSLDQSGGAIVVYVSSAITLNGAVTAIQGGVPNLLIVYLGNSVLSIGGTSGAPFGGSIVAPYVQLSLHQTTGAHVGFFAAQDLLLDANVQLEYALPTAVLSAAGAIGNDGGIEAGDAGEGGSIEAGEGGADGGDAGDSSVTTTCGYDAGTPPTGQPVCGDGWRDPATEECDDGLGNAAVRRGCSAQCKVLDELVVAGNVDAGLTNSRTLGVGRHTVAASTSSFGATYLDPNALTLSLATFSAKGVATGVVTLFSAQSTVVQDSNPVVAALPCDRYAVAWTDYDSEGGNELNVALRIVSPGTTPAAAPTIVNTVTSFSQFDPDIIWTGSELVLAWVDDTDPATAPDLRYATFDGQGEAISGPQTLASTPDSEADVALAPFAGSWAAAWRDDVNGLETVRIKAGTAQWTVQPSFLPAPVNAKPALVALDATHLLVAYAVGLDSTDSGVANGSKLQMAVLDAAAPTAVGGVDVPAMASGAAGLDQSQPNAVTVRGSSFLAWWTAAKPGDHNSEELWLKPLGWNGANLDLSQTEISLPRWAQARVGDQRLPGLAASTLPPGGAIVAAWDDLGRNLSAGEGSGDVVVGLVPTPVLRTGGTGGP